MTKRVIKVQVSWLEAVVEGLRLLNKATDEQVKSFCGKTKAEGFEAWAQAIENEIKKGAGK